MTISVSFLGQQRAFVGTDRIEVEISSNSKVEDVLHYVQRKYPGIDVRDNKFLVAVNNRLSRLDQSLKPDDNIAFLPHIGGG